MEVAAGGNGGGPKKPKPKTGRLVWLEYLDRANSFYAGCRRNMTALPQWREDLPDELHLGLPVEWKALSGNPEVLTPVLPWGWAVGEVEA